MKWLFVLVLSVLTGCGGVNDTDFAGADRAAQARFEAQVRAGAPVIIASVEERGAVAALALATQNRDVTIWVSADNISLGFRGGLLVSTRGLGADLMSGDVEEPMARIRGNQGGLAVRVHRYLDGEDQIVARSFVCEISSRGLREIAIASRRVNTRLIQERCHNPDQDFQNLYWISQQSGRILQSRQWVGPGVGSLALRSVQD